MEWIEVNSGNLPVCNKKIFPEELEGDEENLNWLESEIVLIVIVTDKTDKEIALGKINQIADWMRVTEDCDYDLAINEEVTHWMPIPKLPL